MVNFIIILLSPKINLLHHIVLFFCSFIPKAFGIRCHPASFPKSSICSYSSPIDSLYVLFMNNSQLSHYLSFFTLELSSVSMRENIFKYQVSVENTILLRYFLKDFRAVILPNFTCSLLYWSFFLLSLPFAFTEWSNYAHNISFGFLLLIIFQYFQ